ncbi:hypothetical protein FQN54_005495 [Arachnomyces sp. PD_36]|nr:hypothetical protein FQN54_005495 [Arachnomyces sp. PD_36]
MALAPYPSVASEDAHKMQEKKRVEVPIHLPPGTSEYKYSGFEDMEKAVSEAYDRFINHNQSPLVLFTAVPPEEVEQNPDNFPGKLDYYPTLHILVLSIPSFPHEVAAGVFEQLMTLKAIERGVRRSLSPRGSTTAKTPSRQKDPDKSWSPYPSSLPPGRSLDWPTVALEVAFSESSGQLKQDMGWWLNASNGDVFSTISIDIKRQSGDIYISTWEQGGIPTRQHPNPEPRARQNIAVYRGGNGQDPTVMMDGDLRIPFHELLLRNPGQGESDFTFTREDILEIATGTWDAMGLS